MRRETQIKLNKSRSVTKGKDQINFVELQQKINPTTNLKDDMPYSFQPSGGIQMPRKVEELRFKTLSRGPLKSGFGPRPQNLYTIGDINTKQ